MNARENILSRIRLALEYKGEPVHARPDFSKDPFLANDELIEVTFAENFKTLGGDFFYCEDLETFLSDFKFLLKTKEINHLLVAEEYPQQLLQFAQVDFHPSPNSITESIDASLGLCELLVARTGSIIVSAHQKAARSTASQLSTHIVLAFTSQLVYNIQQGLEIILQKYANNLPSLVSLISGPSKSNALTKNWIPGALGPKELVLFLVDDIIEDSPDTDH